MTNRSITTDIEINGYYFVSTDGVFYRGCTRCGGTGHYSFNGYDSICYKCQNVFELRLGTYIGTREDAEKDAAKRAKAREAREAKREQERLKLVAKQDAKVAAAREAYPGVIEFLESLDVYEERSSFIRDMIENVTFVSKHDKPFTENMAKAVQREMEKRVAKQAEAAQHPVPAGRQVVTGEVISAKVVEGDYGTAYKITVKDDRGFRIYCSLPKAQADEAYDAWVAEIDGDDRSIFDYGYAVWFLGTEVDTEGTTKYGIKGRRITFTATLEQSRDDASFGFGSRPSKGAWL